jgi:hypothetical protein
MKKIFILFTVLLLGFTLFAQNEKDEAEIVLSPEQKAIYPFKDDAEFYVFIQKNIKYPALSRENDIKGRIIIQFIIEKDGTLSNIEAFKILTNKNKKVEQIKNRGRKKDTISHDIQVLEDAEEQLVEVAKKAISLVPPWKPAMNKGNAVRTHFFFPIDFKLE